VYNKSFIVTLCIASLLFPFRAIPTNSQKPDLTWQQRKDTVIAAIFMPVLLAAGYVTSFFIAMVVEASSRASFYHRVKSDKISGIKLADKKIQDRVAHYFYTMRGNSFLDRVLWPIIKKFHCTHVYTGEKANKKLWAIHAGACYHGPFGMYIPTTMLKLNVLSPNARGILCHETAHAKQHSSFFFLLFASLQVLISLEKLRYKLEYNAEETTVKTLLKLQDSDALRAWVQSRIEWAGRLPNDRLFPYIAGTLDTYYRIKKDPHDELCQKIDKVRTWRPTTNWKEAYHEHQKLLSANQSGQQLTPASAA